MPKKPSFVTKQNKIDLLTHFQRMTDMSPAVMAELLGVTTQGMKYWLDGSREIPTPVAKLLHILNSKPEMINLL